MLATAVAVVHLIFLHTVDGREVAINTMQITSLTFAKPQGNRLYVNEVHCLIGMTDGKYVTVTETCDEVRQLLEQTK